MEISVGKDTVPRTVKHSDKALEAWGCWCGAPVMGTRPPYVCRADERSILPASRSTISIFKLTLQWKSLFIILINVVISRRGVFFGGGEGNLQSRDLYIFSSRQIRAKI